MIRSATGSSAPSRVMMVVSSRWMECSRRGRVESHGQLLLFVFTQQCIQGFAHQIGGGDVQQGGNLCRDVSDMAPFVQFRKDPGAQLDQIPGPAIAFLQRVVEDVLLYPGVVQLPAQVAGPAGTALQQAFSSQGEPNRPQGQGAGQQGDGQSGEPGGPEHLLFHSVQPVFSRYGTEHPFTVRHRQRSGWGQHRRRVGWRRASMPWDDGHAG